MKKIKKSKKIQLIIIIIIVLLIMLLNIYSVKNTKNKVEEYTAYITKSYEDIINQEEFLANLPSEVLEDGRVYNLFEIKEQSIMDIEVKDIQTTMEITMTTNDKYTILNRLDKNLEYSKDGYYGRYVLDADSIQIKENYNGNFEYIEDKIIEYTNLEKNDLDFIEKNIYEDVNMFELLNVEWEVEKNKKIGENNVPDTYTALCTYGVIKEMDNPYTYTIECSYIGTAQKEIGLISDYEVIYEFKEIVVENYYEIFTIISFILLSILSYFLIKYILDLKLNLKKGKK